MADKSDTPNEGTVSVEEFEKVKTQMQKWQAKATDSEKRLESYKISPEEVSALKQAHDDLMRERAERGGEKERKELEDHLKSDYEKRYSTKLADLEKERDQAFAELTRHRVETPALLKAADYFNSKELPLIRMVINQELAWDGSGIVVKGDDGKPRYSQKDPRALMGLDEYLESLTERYPGCAKPKAKDGGRHEGTTNNTNKSSNKWERLNRDDVLALSKQEIAEIPLEILRQIMG